jgi:hypothetical protein
MPIMVGVARVDKPVELVVNVQSSEGGFNVVSNSALRISCRKADTCSCCRRVHARPVAVRDVDNVLPAE